MNENGHRFAWQEGYAAFSVSVSNLAQVSEYVRNQPEHHRHMTFEQEFLALLKKHGIDADPAQVFAEGATLRAHSPSQVRSHGGSAGSRI